MSISILLLFSPFLLMTEGCGGGRRVVPTKPAELIIPPDLAKAFEVKELPPTTETNVGLVQNIVKTGTTNTDSKSKKKRRDKTKNQKPIATANKSEESKLAGPGNVDFVIPNRRPNPDPLWVGEKIWMDVTWLSTKAGEFLLEVLPFKVINSRKVYDIKGTARTSELFSLIYKAEDWVETFVDYEGWFPYKFILHGDETKHIRNNLELFDHGAKKQYVHIHDNRIQKNEIHEEKGVKDLTPLSQDSLSALYYARTQKLEDGAVIHFPMTNNGNQWELEVRVVKREEVSTKMGYIKAIKTKVETRFNGVLQQQGDAFIWFSDDERKYPLRFEAKVRIGWVAGIAKKIEPGLPEPAAVEPGPNGREQIPNTEVKAKDARSGVPVPVKADEAPYAGKRRLWFHNLLQSLGSGLDKNNDKKK